VNSVNVLYKYCRDEGMMASTRTGIVDLCVLVLWKILKLMACLIDVIAVKKKTFDLEIALLQEDIVGSLRSRLELLIDEAEQAANDAKYSSEESTLEVTPDDLLMKHLRYEVKPM
jgi:hypothetical protein